MEAIMLNQQEKQQLPQSLLLVNQSQTMIDENDHGTSDLLQGLNSLRTTNNEPLRIPQQQHNRSSLNQGSQSPVHHYPQSSQHPPPRSQLNHYSNHLSQVENNTITNTLDQQRNKQATSQLDHHSHLTSVTNTVSEDPNQAYLNLSGAPNVTKRRRQDFPLENDPLKAIVQPSTKKLPNELRIQEPNIGNGPPRQSEHEITKQTPQSSTRSERNVGHYSLLPQAVGEGTFGKVKLGKHILTGEQVAVKILEKDRISDMADVERIAREIHILKLIRHPNIIQLYEIIETDRQLYLIMEYASGGELFDYIVSKGRVKEQEACRYFQQIIDGVEYLHSLNIVHRDLKPENLLLDQNKNIKIVDFGLSNTYKKGETLITACGSPCYAAPEMIAGLPYLGSRVDIWSCGVIMFALICGYLPFEDPNTTNLYQKILKGEFSIPRFVSKEAADLIRSILCTDPEKRCTIQKIRMHPWFNQLPHTIKRGMNLKDNQVEISKNLLDILESKYDLQREYAEKCIQTNKHNHVTTTYYLLLQKQERQGNDVFSKPSKTIDHQQQQQQNLTQNQQQQSENENKERQDDIEENEQLAGNSVEEVPQDAKRASAGVVYSPREKVAPGENRNTNVNNNNKLEPSAQQMENEMVIKSARSAQKGGHNKSVDKVTIAIVNMKSKPNYSGQKRPPIDNTLFGGAPSPKFTKTLDDRSRQNQVLLDNSRSEQQAGINVSYENSLSVIRRDIKRETLDKKQSSHLTSTALNHKPPKLAISIQFDPIEEKPSVQSTFRSNHQGNTKQTGYKQSLKYGKAMNEYLSKPSPKNSSGFQNISIGNLGGAGMLLRPKTQQMKKGQNPNQSSYSSESHQAMSPPQTNSFQNVKPVAISVDINDLPNQKSVSINSGKASNFHKKGNGSVASASINSQSQVNKSGQLTPKGSSSHQNTNINGQKFSIISSLQGSYATAPAYSKLTSGTLKHLQKPQIAIASASLTLSSTLKQSQSKHTPVVQGHNKNVKTAQLNITTTATNQDFIQRQPVSTSNTHQQAIKNYLSSTPKSKANQIFLMNSLSLTTKAIHLQGSQSPGRNGSGDGLKIGSSERLLQKPTVQSQLQLLLKSGMSSSNTGSKMFSQADASQSSRGKRQTIGTTTASQQKVLGPKLTNSQPLDQHTAKTENRKSGVSHPSNTIPQQQGGMRICKGAFNLNCTTMRNPKELLKIMETLLPQLGITFKFTSSYGIVCTKGIQCFEMEITKYENTDFLYVIRFKKIQSSQQPTRPDSSLEEHMKEDAEFRKISQEILKGLKL